MDDLLGWVFHAGHLSAVGGYAGDARPLLATPAATLGGRPLEHAVGRAQPSHDARPLLVKGAVADPDAYCAFLAATMARVGCAPAQMPLLLTTQDAAPLAERARLAECLLERHAAPALHFVAVSPAALLATGRADALVLDCGAYETRCAVVHAGLLLRRSLRAAPWGGEHVTAALRAEVGELPPVLLGDAHRRLKEDLLALECPALPDGRPLTSLCEPARPLFEGPRALQALVGELLADEADGRRAPAAALLTGGNAALPGLQREVERRLGEGSRLRLAAARPAERRHAAWLGASVLAALADFQPLWLTRADLAEQGEAALLRKCPN